VILDEFGERMSQLITALASSQREAIVAVASQVEATVVAGHSLFAFGCNHSGLLVQDLYYRAGGCMLVNPLWGPGMNLQTDPPLFTSDMERMPGLAQRILDHSPLSAGDLLFVVSTSGRNTVPVEMAEKAKERGAVVVALTSLAYTHSVTSAAPSGRRLFEVADYVLDNGAPAGDALLTLSGLEVPVAPVSTITGSFVLHAVMAVALESMAAHGLTVPVFRSGNLEGGREHNQAVFRQYASQIHYPLR
jgi:uncharacterized phosphosugar-binding protein